MKSHIFSEKRPLVPVSFLGICLGFLGYARVILVIFQYRHQLTFFFEVMVLRSQLHKIKGVESGVVTQFYRVYNHLVGSCGF